MKQHVMAIWLGWAALAAALPALAASVPPAAGAPAAHVLADPRVELFSILSHLAGYPEYNMGQIASYEKDIEAHFGSFREHAAVVLMRRLREERNIGFDAVMNLAIRVTDASGLQESSSFDTLQSDLDPRWRLEDARAVLEQARRFVKDTRFEEFWQAHRSLYELTETRMRQLLAKEIDLAWFDRFFGQRPAGDLLVIPGLVNGGACYGLKLKREDGSEDLYAVMGAWLKDEAGQPLFDESLTPFIVHEFAHSYVNHVVEKHRQELGGAGEQVYQAVAEPMRKQAYDNWKTMIDESLVRAAVVRYLAAHKGPDTASGEIEEQETNRAFLWMSELAALLAQYEASRERYPTLDSFLPEVVSYYRGLAPRIQGMVQERTARAGR